MNKDRELYEEQKRIINGMRDNILYNWEPNDAVSDVEGLQDYAYYRYGNIPVFDEIEGEYTDFGYLMMYKDDLEMYSESLIDELKEYDDEFDTTYYKRMYKRISLDFERFLNNELMRVIKEMDEMYEEWNDEMRLNICDFNEFFY
jgi:hypothetical protein